MRDTELKDPSRPHRSEALGPYGCWPYIDRRLENDRRARPTRLFSRYTLRGRREGGRRREERANVYVDRYYMRDVNLALAILVLNVVDAYFTLDYLGKGGTEANPFAQYLINTGTEWFIFSKAVVVALCLLFLLLHKTFRFVRPALLVLLAFYGVLFAYHVYLQVDLFLHPPMRI